MKTHLAIFVAAASAGLSVPAQAVVLYANDFDSAATVAGGVTAVGLTNGTLGTASAGSWNASGWNGNIFVNKSVSPILTSTLTLTGLAPNSAVTISGIIGLLNSWDSTDGGGGVAPDFLDFYFNGVSVTSLTTNNGLGTNVYLDGATLIAYKQNTDNDTYFGDTLADFAGAAFVNGTADGTGQFVLGIAANGAGWQGGSDEFWGLDSLTIEGTVAQTGAVPEPSTWAMMLLGMGGIGMMMRRRKAPQVSYSLT